MKGKIKVWNQYTENDPDWALMRKKYTRSFYELYNLGFKEYESGDWSQAKKYFEMAEVLIS